MEPLRPEDPAEIGGYPLVARVGAGGMGQVYLGLTGGGRHIALKVIREDFEGPQALARFRREVATVERVRSRFAAAMVGAGLDAPPYWLATEYVPGPTLRQAVAEHGPLPADTCLRLLGALAQGLLDIHGQGVQHRDLKPGNVILAPDGPRLIDFGIARGEGQTQITQTGAWNGTPGYVAPEVVREQEPVPASDVFSLAGTIAYAATGRPPFGGGRIEAIIHRTLDGEIDLDGADPRVAELVRRCAEKEPGSRIALAELVGETASPFALADDPVYRERVGVPPPVPASVADAASSGLVRPERFRTPATGGTGPRSRAAVIAAGAAIVVVVLGGAFAARSVFNDDAQGGGNAARSGGPQANGGPAAGGTADGGASAAPGGSPAGRSPGAGGRPPDKIFLKQPTADFSATEFSPGDSTCLPAVRPEDESLSGQLQVSAPRRPHSGETVDFSMRFKYERPSGYYVAAQLRPPGPHGSAGPGWMQSKPHLYPAAPSGVELTFPDDFVWDGSGAGTDPELRAGVWTIVWLHVHSNGDAVYIGCDGFTAA
ncbi:serine/threonine-protein kinase [Actinomadura sp. 7K507]|uniref:serine/threonine-protein kinase n=1 Tax=Actinomadura sp. 7K507 TaxID=2530365 RepID=UPI001052A25E|nr:serine/threonine-protein kinase [Actinomadura sp. 7K507]TDC83945.1 serine/threonine protein kinase [Actinomadura sp. 7K507]